MLPECLSDHACSSLLPAGTRCSGIPSCHGAVGSPAPRERTLPTPLWFASPGMGHSTLRLVIVGYGAVTAAGSAVVALFAPSIVPAFGLVVNAGVHPPLTMAQLKPSKRTHRRLRTPRLCPGGVRQAPPRAGTMA